MDKNTTYGYLLDTNIISYLANPECKQYHIVKKHFQEAQKNKHKMMIPVLAIAEIEFGLVAAPNPDPEQQENMRKSYTSWALPLKVDENTVEPYSLIRAKLFEKYGTKKGRSYKEKDVSYFQDRVTAKNLGITEIDLLIACIAVQYGFILVTGDTKGGMPRIKKAIDELEKQGKPISLQFMDWTSADGTYIPKSSD